MTHGLPFGLERSKRTPHRKQKQKQRWCNKRTIVVTIKRTQNNSTIVWHSRYGFTGLADHFIQKMNSLLVIQHTKHWWWTFTRSFTGRSHSHLEQRVPSQCRSRSESPAGANPAGIVSDCRTAPAGRAAPCLRTSRLIQTHKNAIVNSLWMQDTEDDDNRAKRNSPASKHCRTSRPPPAVKFLYRVGLSRPAKRRAYGHGDDLE